MDDIRALSLAEAALKLKACSSSDLERGTWAMALVHIRGMIEQKKSGKNRIVSIGYMGDRKAFLNMSKDEAIEKFCELEEISLEKFYSIYSEDHIDEEEFEDWFLSYD